MIQLTRFEDIRSGFFNTEYVGEGTKVKLRRIGEKRAGKTIIERWLMVEESKCKK